MYPAKNQTAIKELELYKDMMSRLIEQNIYLNQFNNVAIILSFSYCASVSATFEPVIICFRITVLCNMPEWRFQITLSCWIKIWLFVCNGCYYKSNEGIVSNQK